jgi:Flp pilus assembly protein TadB
VAERTVRNKKQGAERGEAQKRRRRRSRSRRKQTQRADKASMLGFFFVPVCVERFVSLFGVAGQSVLNPLAALFCLLLLLVLLVLSFLLSLSRG